MPALSTHIHRFGFYGGRYDPDAAARKLIKLAHALARAGRAHLHREDQRAVTVSAHGHAWRGCPGGLLAGPLMGLAAL